jgi:hypothetical protein
MGLALMSAAALGACNRQDGAGEPGHVSLAGGSKYCTPFPTANANTNSTGLAVPTTADPATSFDDCIHRWGYTLASSRDPADVVAQASVEACSSILINWSRQAASQAGGDTGQQDEAQGGQGGGMQQPDPMAQRMHAAEGRALFYVVQARAGGCAAPPANTLTSPSAPVAG